MNIARTAGYGCFWACILPIGGAMAAEQPGFLVAIPSLILVGLAFLVAAEVIEMLGKIKTEIETLRIDNTVGGPKASDTPSGPRPLTWRAEDGQR